MAEVSLLLLARLKARRLDDYSSLRNYTKKAVGGGDILFLPALNFLYLMGLIEYRLKTDAVEYVGLYAGCNYFALVHHLQHHRGKDLAGVAYLRRLERFHDLHHHRQVVNFGISTTIWDRPFGTFEPTNEPATDYFFWSTIRSYWMKLTCKPSATS